MLKKLTLLALCIAAMHKSTVAMNNKFMAAAAVGLASYYLVVKPFFRWGLREGAKIELERNPQALHVACRYHVAYDIEHIKLLLAVGADINRQDKDGKTPLHVVNSKEVAEVLIQAGANVNARDKYGNTPLHGAVSRDSKEVVEALIKAGVDLNAQDKYGRTPLHVAANWNDKGVAKMLIKAGADLNAQDKDGATPLHQATFWNKQEAVESLINKTLFYPSIAGARRYKHTLQEQCLDVLLKKWYISDIVERKNIITGIACYLDIDPERSQALNTLAEHAPLEMQQDVVKMWREHKSEINDNKIKQFVEAHGERHLAKIKHVLSVQDNYKKTARDRAQGRHYDAIVQLIDQATGPKKFSDLNPAMQKAMRLTIEHKLTM